MNLIFDDAAEIYKSKIQVATLEEVFKEYRSFLFFYY